MEIKKRDASHKLLFLVFLAMCLFAIVQLVKAQPLERIVFGTVYRGNTLVQVESGIDVLVNNTNISLIKYTKTSGPPGFTGAYSLTLNSTLGHLIYARAWNFTNYGFRYGLMNATSVTININLNLSRTEPMVRILYPPNNTVYDTNTKFNVTANISMIGNDATNCNATILIWNTSVVNLSEGESLTHNLGNIARGVTSITFWNLTGYYNGITNISVSTRCGSDLFYVYNHTNDTVYNITKQDTFSPIVRRMRPLNNTMNLSPVFFFFNVSDASPLQNCFISINNITMNTTNNPLRERVLNLSVSIFGQVYAFWEVNCTDIYGNQGSTGLFNLTLNSDPSITNLFVEDPINLIAGGTKIVYCNGTASDANTYFNIAKVNASLFQEGKQPNSPDNASNHYFNSSCSFMEGIGNDRDFSCAFNLSYYSNNGTWHCNATVSDIYGAKNSTQISTIVNSMLAIGVSPNIIDFGALEILQISPSDIRVNVTNYGNVLLDTDIYAYALYDGDGLAMECTKGNVSHTYERISSSSGQGFNVMSPVNDSSNKVFVNLNVPKREGGMLSESKVSSYWKLQIPMYTGGKCNGKVVFTALNG